MTVPGSAVPFPSPQLVDRRRIRMWDPTVPGRPEHDVGDLVVGIAPEDGKELARLDTAGWAFDGPVWLPGFRLRPQGDIAADYSTPEAPVLGVVNAVVSIKFSPKARCHWDRGAKGHNPFVGLFSTDVDWKNNIARKPCSFGDLLKARVQGRKGPHDDVGLNASVLISRLRVRHGAGCVSNSVDQQPDRLQYFGGVDDVQCGDSSIQIVGGQLLFVGSEPTVSGNTSDTQWRLSRVVLDHRLPWNPALRAHGRNTYPRLVDGHEGVPRGAESPDAPKGAYPLITFDDVVIRGPYARTDRKSVRQYVGSGGGVESIDPVTGLFRFKPRIQGRAAMPMCQGSLQYMEANDLAPIRCPPSHAGPAHRVTSPEQALAAMLGTL
jgi:hypothetical protein